MLWRLAWVGAALLGLPLGVWTAHRWGWWALPFWAVVIGLVEWSVARVRRGGG